MKKLPLLLCLITGSLLHVSIARAQEADSTGLPGDNFSLQGAIEMFKKAGSPEEFEKMINTESNNVNNLDLNNDGQTDYVRVIDKSDKEAHAFVLQVAVSETENQDIAVIELEKTGAESAILQIVGDEEIYGEQVIVEASDGSNDDEEENPAKNGPSFSYYSNPPMVVNVWLWPSVRFVYRPAYVPWVSPWRWKLHPTWWRPWRPLGWRVFHPLARRHHPFCRVVRTHRVVVAHRVYTPFRTSSVVVRNRHAGAVRNYRVTRTRTTVTGPRGGKVKVTRTKVRGKRG
ncbi:MAG TPA: hypothetical protein PKC54_06705 [Ferruginibacter sp.]|nr:hypothetical protein [Ferruginibacter sp.]